MMPRSPVARLLFFMIGLDAVFSALSVWSYLVQMGIDHGAAARTAVGLFAVAWVIKAIAFTAIVGSRLRPLAQWAGSSPTTDEASIRQVAQAAYRAPFVVSSWWTGMFVAKVVLVFVVLYVGFADV